jgi:virginiamycin B lyase
MRNRCRGLLPTVIVLLGATVGVAKEALAQAITEFPVPTANSEPAGITMGPDGALWFIERSANKIGRITTAGVVTNEFPIPTANSGASIITTGPDGALWFIEQSANKIGRITTAGAVTNEFPIPTANSGASIITTGADGALWFTEKSANKIGRITTAGVVTNEFPIPTANGQPAGITTGPDGALWFIEGAANKIGRITTAVVVTNEFPVPTPNGTNGFPQIITTGPDGALWFTECGAAVGSNQCAASSIGRITTAGATTEFPIPVSPLVITTGLDGALWFAEEDGNNIGRITTAGVLTQFPIPKATGKTLDITAGPDGALWFTEFGSNSVGRLSLPPSKSLLLSAVLPSSRSVQVGATATAFATMINAGTSTATSCGIAPVTGVPASFLYQTTDPANNALTGSANTPVNIAAGAAQSFVIAFTANAPFVPTVADIGFACTNAAAASSNPGLNTLLLSGSTMPVPDIVALAATTTNDGILHITGTMGSAAFAVATVNLGSSSAITATANTGSVTLPLTITLCETVPSTGACMTTPSTSSTTTINANATPTFAFFATASGAVPFSPAVNRIFVQFSDAGGVVRGSTSVAVQTQ